jgi:hypothetical protein
MKIVCLECETTLISLLLIIFEILRTQMGTELINNILQTTFSAFNMFVLIFIVFKKFWIFLCSENVRTVLRESKPNAHTAVAR